MCILYPAGPTKSYHPTSRRELSFYKSQHWQQQRPIKKGCLGIKKMILPFIKNVVFPFCILMATIRNDLPLFASAMLEPYIYLTIKAFLNVLLLPLLVLLDNDRENGVLLSLALLAFQFATASPYGPCTISFMNINSCTMETGFMASAGAVNLLVLFIWATVKERDRNLLLVMLFVLLGSTVPSDFSLLKAEVLCIVVLLYFWLWEMLHAFHIVDDNVHLQVEITKSDIVYYVFCSFVMICSLRPVIRFIRILQQGSHYGII